MLSYGSGLGLLVGREGKGGWREIEKKKKPTHLTGLLSGVSWQGSD